MSFETRLRKETPRWVAAGVVTAEQARRIEAWHAGNEGAAARRFLGVLTMLGGVLCVVGLALVIKANWEHVHRWWKLATLVVLLGAAYGFGFGLKEGPRQMGRTGGALLMAGCGLFLLGIVLVGQIYHLSGLVGDAVALWIAGIAAVPFLTRTRGTFFVLLLAVDAWVWSSAVEPGGRLTGLAGLQGSEEMALLFSLLCLSLALYWSAAWWSARWRSFAAMQRAWALIGVGATVYAAGFFHNEWVVRSSTLLAEPAAVGVGLVLLVSAMAARVDFAGWRRLSPWLLLAAVPAAIAVGGFFGETTRVVCAWLSSGALVLLGVFMARAGLQEEKPWLVNAGIGFIALTILTRYFDVFASMLDQGLMFLVSGVVVLGLGWVLEGRRRVLLRAIRQGGEA
ncbi:DUF2157 domain-containing protein [Horticoccus luteus]|uniref:DUF2157 domain-containing protein n=1 Tax=Horticoccus luteus TaxID=2862869 RepID=A0A8F9XGF0_9BACT|nr:DUF2157 domain-containing protein [Horticoccus luteus]QYM79117.1 DUF2157 domain-containing protein [Horticoccus luteus]